MRARAGDQRAAEHDIIRASENSLCRSFSANMNGLVDIFLSYRHHLRFGRSRHALASMSDPLVTFIEADRLLINKYSLIDM